jgi:tRNA pseudouridine38-40 synthase
MVCRYFVEVTYDGTVFHGSQLQGDLPTVQYFINKSLTTLLREDIKSFGASRTDEGVHALSSFYHFDTNNELSSQFLYKVNCILPEHISIKSVFQVVGKPINARFDAISRTYRYRIFNSKDPFKQNRAHYYPFKINREILDETATIIKQNCNFESFSKRKTNVKNFACHVFESYWLDTEDELQYVVKANRFLRGMVRGLVGTQLKIARKGNIPDLIQIIEAKDCTLADFSFPGHGLYLEHIEYPEGKLLKIL